MSLSLILPLLEIYQISLLRMKAETLSWSSGCLSATLVGVQNGPQDDAKVRVYFETAKLQTCFSAFFVFFPSTSRRIDGFVRFPLFAIVK